MSSSSENCRRVPARGIAALFLITAVALSQQAKKAEKTHDLVLESANFNENQLNRNGDLVSVLRGNVVFRYDSITIRSDQATWRKAPKDETITFVGKVKAFQKGQTITCDRMDGVYREGKNVFTANGKFAFYDSAEQTLLTGDQAEYFPDTKYFQLKGNPRFMRFDTAASETLVITSQLMSYVDSQKCATAHNDVRITKGVLLSTCARADYLTEQNSARLRTGPEVFYELHHVTGDSIDLQFGKQSLRSASVVGKGHGLYVDTSGGQSDTGYTHVWGDSLYMSVNDSGYLDTLWSYGKASSKYYVSSSAAQSNEASGKVMMLAFSKNGNAENAKIWGNARSTYFVTEKDGSGRNEASGDSISVFFENGKARHLSLAGSVRGTYFPEL